MIGFPLDHISLEERVCANQSTFALAESFRVEALAYRAEASAAHEGLKRKILALEQRKDHEVANSEKLQRRCDDLTTRLCALEKIQAPPSSKSPRKKTGWPADFSPTKFAGAIAQVLQKSQPPPVRTVLYTPPSQQIRPSSGHGMQFVQPQQLTYNTSPSQFGSSTHFTEFPTPTPPIYY